jgi:hypothetical protein
LRQSLASTGPLLLQAAKASACWRLVGLEVLDVGLARWDQRAVADEPREGGQENARLLALILA